MVDLAEYELEIFVENPEDHEHHGSNWVPGSRKLQGTITGKIPIRTDLRLVTEEGYKLDFYLSDSFGTVVPAGPLVDAKGNVAP